MPNYSIQLKKLQLEGPNKENAVIDFNSGLNIISGASDTGKSFAFECINYALGAIDIPEIPQEAQGYTDVLLEFTDKKSNQQVTLKRSLLESNKSDIYYIYSDISNLSDASFEVLSVSNNAKNSLSGQLLSICNCPYRNILKKSSNGETESFTFRKYIYLMMLNETRIVQKNSPIYLGDTRRDRNATKETASFFTILTGLDYQKYVKTESLEIKKAHLKGAIDELTLICSELEKEISSSESSDSLKYQLKETQAIILDIEQSLQMQRKITESLENSRQEEITSLNTAIRDKSRVLDNLSKFTLLKKNYISDVSRLEFIEQSHNYTGQLVDVTCPICHTEMRTPVQNSEIYYLAICKEKEKLNAHLVDLQATISDFESELLSVNQKITQGQKRIHAFEDELTNHAKEISLILTKHEKYLEIRDKLLAIENNKRKLSETRLRIQELNDRINNTKRTSEKVVIKKPAEELIEEFCTIIQKLLESWKFIGHNNVVRFNQKNNDVVVCGKEKATYGKGARAIINSAFIIAIMEYCYQHGLPHPGFVILDSPLTTYKERDRQANRKNEDVDVSIKAQFFYNLASMSKHQQIIIFDNEIPPEDLTDVTYHHFTGNQEIYRTGFIPQQN